MYMYPDLHIIHILKHMISMYTLSTYSVLVVNQMQLPIYFTTLPPLTVFTVPVPVAVVSFVGTIFLSISGSLAGTGLLLLVGIDICVSVYPIYNNRIKENQSFHYLDDTPKH